LGAAIKFPKAKVIVLDADNTLWGGIIGEDGIDGLPWDLSIPATLSSIFNAEYLITNGAD
jgi:predicted enzyme involved in methoxymalonyl-ACP biosynthesis